MIESICWTLKIIAVQLFKVAMSPSWDITLQFNVWVASIGVILEKHILVDSAAGVRVITMTVQF